MELRLDRAHWACTAHAMSCAMPPLEQRSRVTPVGPAPPHAVASGAQGARTLQQTLVDSSAYGWGANGNVFVRAQGRGSDDTAWWQIFLLPLNKVDIHGLGGWAFGGGSTVNTRAQSFSRVG